MSYSATVEQIILTFSLKKCENHPNYSISIKDKSLGNEEIFQTEEIENIQNVSEIIFSKKMSLNYYFGKIQKLLIKVTKKFKTDDPSKFKIKEYERFTTLSSLIASPNSKYERPLDEKKDSEILSIKVDKENNEKKKNYLFDYFKSGVKLSCFISADFSNSKNNLSKDLTNDNYKLIIKRISEYIAVYTKSHKFYAYGFNAKVRKSSSKETVFNLDISQKNSTNQTMEKVRENFEKCITENLIIPENNIILSNLIKKITNDIYNAYELRFYNVSFIIIRGVLDKNDIEKTIDAIIESSYLPLTIIIIGVGKNDYSQMKKIFGKKHKFSSLGMQKMRDNVKFTSLIDDFSNDVDILISWCLGELSKQILYYYDLIKSSPKQINENKVKNIEESFNLYNSSICLERSKIISESDLYKINQKISFILDDDSDSKKYKNQINEDTKEPHINQKINILDNPYAKDPNLSQTINKENIEESAISELSEKKFVNKKPQIYGSVVEKTKVKKKEDGNNEQALYTPTPSDSICPQIINNPFNEKNENNICDFNTPIPVGSISTEIKPNPYNIKPTPGRSSENDYESRKFIIPKQSVIDKNQNNDCNNPYLKDSKTKNSGLTEQNNNYLGIKKNSKMSNCSEFNSTNNSENMKSSNNYIFYNNYSIDSSH